MWLEKWIPQELGSFEIQKRSILKEWIIVLKSCIEKSLRTNISVCATQELCLESNLGMS